MFGLPMIYLRIGAALAVLGLLLWARHAIFQDGYDEGAAHVQAQFNEYRGTIQRITQQRETENAIKAAEVKATNEATLHAYQNQLAAIANDRDSLAKRLREHQVRTSGATVSAAISEPGATEPSPQPSGLSEVDRSLDEFKSACLADAAQLDALIGQIKHQLP